MDQAVHLPPGAVTQPSRDALVARARAMIPALRERAARAEAERRIPAETMDALRQAGFFRILQPRRWGGFEMDPGVFFDVQMALAEGCMSTGWVFGVVGGHPYELALFPDQAQRDVWGKDDNVLASSSYQPVGRVERVPDGFMLSGHWGFSSGCDYCDWVLLGALVPPEAPGGPPEMRTFLLPRTDYSIVDAWHVFGLQGTGSQDIVVERAFVPEYRTHKASDGFLCRNPGQTENDAPLFRLPWAQVFLRLVSTAALGAARGALQAYIEIAGTRVSTNTGKATKADPIAQNAAAKLHAQIDEMTVVLHRNCEALMAHARAGREIPLEERLRYRYQSASVVRRCAELVDTLMPLLGGRAIYLSSPIVRHWLDLQAARAHVANLTENWGPELTSTLLGEAPAFTFA